MDAQYTDHDSQRIVSEPPKRAGRTPFERDRARVLHSSALRRLAAKTQVMMAGESDFPRTRLTHTLEVAKIARELGSSLGADPDVCDLAGLAHDLGHPPFGHNGEDALDEVAASIGGFEGNAQSFRVLVRLESKVLDHEGRSVGLNLTRASLDGVIKYPWERRQGTRKFNVYQDDRAIFDWVRDGAEQQRRCFEAQVMDWSDDVAYSVHDVEDGLHGRHIDLGAVWSPDERAAICQLAHEWYAPTAEPAELQDALDRILALPFWPAHFDGSWHDMVALKNLTSQLIGRFVNSAMEATRVASEGRPVHRYSGNLIVPANTRSEVSVLKALANLFVFQRDDAVGIYERQRQIIGELVEALEVRVPDCLDPIFLDAWDHAPDDASRRRIVIDQVASLTDSSVVKWHAAYCG